MIRNIRRVLLSGMWVTIIGILNSFVFPRLLSIEEYAVYQTFTLYMAYVGALHLGIPSGMFILYAGQDFDKINKAKYKSEILLIVTVLAFFCCIGIVSFFLLHKKMLLYVSLCLISVNIITTYKSLYQAVNKFQAFAIINVVVPTSITLLGIIGYLFGILSAQLLIYLNLSVNFIVSVVLLYIFFQDTKSVKGDKLLNRNNWNTFTLGFSVMIGNFINTLFHSIDKQMIRILFEDYPFAMYSFAMSMQTIMTVFITAIAQPLYPQMAKDNELNKESIGFIKELLFGFGSLSGCAYFACSVFVQLFVPKYMDSLKVIGIFFAAFPAIAVINCILVSLYKITKQIKKYILTLLAMLIIAFAANLIAIRIQGTYIGISAATTITYYIWLVVSVSHFDVIRLTLRDVVYLIGFAVLFFLIINSIANGFIGCIVFFLLIAALFCVIYGHNFKYYKRLYFKLNN